MSSPSRVLSGLLFVASLFLFAAFTNEKSIAAVKIVVIHVSIAFNIAAIIVVTVSSVNCHRYRHHPGRGQRPHTY